MLMFRYWGFGLNILSQIEFPELLPAVFDHPDLTIQYGKTPDVLEGEGIVKRAFSYIARDEYLLSVRKVSKYYAGHGSQIIAEPLPGIDEKSVRLFLLGTVMAAILYQRGSMPLHAAAVIKDGQLVLFAGNSGAGKSTLTGLMASKGYDIFTDDICVMHHNIPGKPGVFGTASYPMIKLWEDALNSLENSGYTRDFKIRPAIPKYGQFFFDKFNSSLLKIAKIFILHPYSHQDDIKVKKLPPVQAFKQLEYQAYKRQLITANSLRAIHFSLLTGLTGNVPVYEITRPANGTTCEQLYETIKDLM